MPRKRPPFTADTAFHVTARCANREWFSIPLPEVWEIMTDYLYLMHHAFELQIHAFVLMSNHFHMIVRSPRENLSQTMNYFMRETSRAIGFEAKRINQIYGARHHRSTITSYDYYLCVYRYVYRNPVDAGIVEKVESYPFSSLAVLLGQSYGALPLVDDLLLFGDVEKQLEWLNTPYEDNQREKVRKALRRAEFAFPKVPGSKK